MITLPSRAYIVNFWNTNVAFYVCPTVKILFSYSSCPSSGEFSFFMILTWPSDMLAMPPSSEIADWINKPSVCPLKTLKQIEPRRVLLVKISFFIATSFTHSPSKLHLIIMGSDIFRTSIHFSSIS